jgi:hypothetical protein
MFAVSIDNLLFFLLIAVAALFQLLSTALKKAGKNETDDTPDSLKPQIPSPVRRGPTESDADRIRKFLEALGQPPSSTPPPPVAPRADIPPRRLAPVQPPRVIPRAWGSPREQRNKPELTRREAPSPEQPRRLQEIVPPPIPGAVAPAFEVHEALPVELQPPTVKAPVEAYAASTRPAAKAAEFKTHIAILLGSKSGLRQAIILREIFGPPRSLQPLDLVGNA